MNRLQVELQAPWALSYYDAGVESGHLMDEEDAGKASGRYEAALYAQMVIKRDTV